MQYLLTEEEFKALVSKKELEIKDAALEFARKRILMLSRQQCIHDKGGLSSVCDNCPCLATDEEHEKERIELHNSRLVEPQSPENKLWKIGREICKLRKQFSK